MLMTSRVSMILMMDHGLSLSNQVFLLLQQLLPDDEQYEHSQYCQVSELAHSVDYDNPVAVLHERTQTNSDLKKN